MITGSLMSYKSEWVAILANFKTKINAYLANPNSITVSDLEEVQNEFIAFIDGYSMILRDDACNIQVIDVFNRVYLNKSNTVSDDDTINNLQTLIDSFDTAIIHNKEEKMTTNYNVSGNAQFGNNNSQTNTHNATDININLQTLINEIEKSGDTEAKSKLLDLLNNGTIASILGVTAAEVVKFFS
ncbi:hypothetical protein GCM10016272_14570 [Psychrobacter glaciei]|uniref:Uncharacterized protein n=2 Tax=Psychrobacter glaciei TaxID=619771 RepID=A0ABQ3GRF5_9GAMM|nr:hypothetical protein GCM10016272_14570 [Psychrobacter glaciei]